MKKKSIKKYHHKDTEKPLKQIFFQSIEEGKDHILKKKIILSFLYYISTLSIFSLYTIFHQHFLLFLFFGLLFLYFLLIIIPQYDNTKSLRRNFFLPCTQIIQDFLKFAGTIIGIMLSIHWKKMLSNNKANGAVILFYIIVVLSGIEWGIPNNNHPFAYHMDEWAQSQSIRAIFKHGTPNMEGASSRGVIFQYFLSGIYLIPFILLHIVNPFIIKSSLEHIAMQHRFFEILRLNSLIFGVLSIILVIKIAKNHLKIHPILPILFFTVTPIFLSLSNYFKYDIALCFWIITSILCIFRYGKNPTLRNFIFAGVVSALALSTKISAIPLIFVYLFSFFLYTPKQKEKYSWLFIGILIFIGVFFIAGIPDFWIGRSFYLQWLNLNLNLLPKNDIHNFLLGSPYWIYLPFVEYPAIFGRFFYYTSLFSIILLSFFTLQNLLTKKITLKSKHTVLLLSSLIAFIISVVPLRIEAVGNRALVFLPFLALLSGIGVEKIIKFTPNPARKIILLLLSIGLVLQFSESLAWVSTRIGPDPRESSSIWIEKNVKKGTSIGIENVPIFQFVPDLVLKEFYAKVYNEKTGTTYNYYVVDSKTKHLPSLIIISNADIQMNYLKKSDKIDLVKRLQTEKYKKVAYFTPNFYYYQYFNTEKTFFFSPIIASPVSITIYKK